MRLTRRSISILWYTTLYTGALVYMLLESQRLSDNGHDALATPFMRASGCGQQAKVRHVSFTGVHEDLTPSNQYPTKAPLGVDILL